MMAGKGRFNAPAKVTDPAEKLPPPSRLTRVLGRLELVAALAAMTPVATFAAVCPPTEATTVAPCGPDTSPETAPEKLVAKVAMAAEPALKAKIACGVAVISWRGARMVKTPPPLVRTAICSQWVEPLKTLEPKSIVVMNKPLLLTAIAVLVIGPPTGPPPLLVLNRVKTMSAVLLP